METCTTCLSLELLLMCLLFHTVFQWCRISKMYLIQNFFRFQQRKNALRLQQSKGFSFEEKIDYRCPPTGMSNDDVLIVFANRNNFKSIIIFSCFLLFFLIHLNLSCRQWNSPNVRQATTKQKFLSRSPFSSRLCKWKREKKVTNVLIVDWFVNNDQCSVCQGLIICACVCVRMVCG